MKKIFVFLWLFCFPGLLLTGCRKQAPVSYNLAEKIEITCQHKDVLIRRNYTSQEKMGAVLLYLRLLQTGNTAKTNPTAFKKEIYQIRVQLSDGRQHIYQQTAHQYFKGYKRPWMHISAEDAKGLYDILARYESDPFVPVITSGYKI